VTPRGELGNNKYYMKSGHMQRLDGVKEVGKYLLATQGVGV